MEDKIIKILEDYGELATHTIAHKLIVSDKTVFVNTGIVRRIMKKMEKAGSVKRNFFTRNNCIVWELPTT